MEIPAIEQTSWSFLRKVFNLSLQSACSYLVAILLDILLAILRFPVPGVVLTPSVMAVVSELSIVASLFRPIGDEEQLVDATEGQDDQEQYFEREVEDIKASF